MKCCIIAATLSCCSAESLELVPGTGARCSNIDLYVGWAEQWANTCRQGLAANTSWFQSCSWVNCECLWQLPLAPVPVDEVNACFTQAREEQRLSTDVKWFVTALLRTCRSHTNELSRPCGLCDRYRGHRGCSGPVANTNSTVPI